MVLEWLGGPGAGEWVGREGSASSCKLPQVEWQGSWARLGMGAGFPRAQPSVWGESKLNFASKVEAGHLWTTCVPPFSALCIPGVPASANAGRLGPDLTGPQQEVPLLPWGQDPGVICQPPFPSVPRTPAGV